MREIRRGHGGISLLLEVIVGFSIFGVALILTFSAFPLSHRAVTRSKNVAQALNLAREYIERYRTMSYGTLDDDAAIAYGDAVVNGVAVRTTYNVELDVTELTTAASQGWDSKHLLVTVRWAEGESNQQVQLETVVVSY